MKRIVVTGGIGAGKSSVCAEFARLGLPTISADEVARLVVVPGEQGAKGVADLFGQAVMRTDGSIDRQRVASIVFADPEARVRLEELLHPLIRRRIEEEIAKLTDYEAVVIEVPLFTEATARLEADVVVVVTASREVRQSRLMASRGYSEDDVAVRSAAQADEYQRQEVADYLIDNSGSRVELARQVRKIWDDIRTLPDCKCPENPA
jgi:dephospho-CoA kinase